MSIAKAGKYRARIVDAELAARLEAMGGVVIEGPKACGKTETARRVAASEVLLDVDAEARQAAAVDPSLVLEGATPRLIDEWQVEPKIWNHVRREIDERSEPGQFILTGSAVPSDQATRHTGAGRMTRLRMRPMSLFEAGRSTGRISLGELLAGAEARSPDPKLRVKDLANEIVIGGWPASRELKASHAEQAVRDYLDEVRRTDVSQVDTKKRDPEKVAQLLRSLARNTATSASVKTLAQDAGGADEAPDRKTIIDYLDALSRLMIIEDQPAWAPHLRSKYVLRRAAKRHFVDPSLAAAALSASPETLMQDLNLLGLLFESLVIRDLRIYAQAHDGAVLQYRDSNDQEVDAIVRTRGGAWAGFEVKLGTGLVDQGAESLKTFAKQIDMKKCGEPACLGVIVGTGYGYVREDGIKVIPIGSLGP